MLDGRSCQTGGFNSVNALSIHQIPIIKLICHHYIVRAKHVSPLHYFAFAIIYIYVSPPCLTRHTIPAFMATLPDGRVYGTDGSKGHLNPSAEKKFLEVWGYKIRELTTSCQRARSRNGVAGNCRSTVRE